MATYATVADLEAYIEGWVTDDAAAAERLLARAERDVDNVLGPLPLREDNGLKLAPAELPEHERDALSRAVCAQAEHRFRRGRELGSAPAKRVKGPDFELEYGDQAAAGSGLYSPRLPLELAPLRYLRRTGARARA